MNLKDNEIIEKIKIFNKEIVVVEFDDVFETKFELFNTTVSYNRKKSYLTFKDRATNSEIKINIAMVVNMDFIDNTLKIDLEDMELKMYTK